MFLDTLIEIAEEGWRENQGALSASYGNCQGWSQMLCALKAGVLAECNEKALSINVFRRGDVNDRSLCRTSHAQAQCTGGNTTEIEAMQHEGFRTACFANAGFIVQHLAHGILT